MTSEFWDGKNVLLTGHTGFKGGWLALSLQDLGANVVGYSLPPPTEPSFYETARVGEGMREIAGDILDLAKLTKAFEEFSPEIVFHLAAQSLVRVSYENPVGTYAANLLGTVHLLEAVRLTKTVRSVVIVTSDKCYENREWVWSYRETDPLGGRDPYSSSKACVELAVDSYRRSFFSVKSVGIATARAGNVIGGGDWARDRLIPDLVRAAISGTTLVLRNPRSVRPWQHVLEPLSGYLRLAQALWNESARYAEAWNFGPVGAVADKTVEDLVVSAARAWKSELAWRIDEDNDLGESRVLKLDASKAVDAGWRPLLNLDRAIEWTMEWYRAWTEHRDVRAVSLDQIRLYRKLATEGLSA